MGLATLPPVAALPSVNTCKREYENSQIVVDNIIIAVPPSLHVVRTMDTVVGTVMMSTVHLTLFPRPPPAHSSWTRPPVPLSWSAPAPVRSGMMVGVEPSLTELSVIPPQNISAAPLMDTVAAPGNIAPVTHASTTDHPTLMEPAPLS